MNRRTFITGIAGMLAAKQTAAFVPSGILMPVRKIIVPEPGLWSSWNAAPEMHWLSPGSGHTVGPFRSEVHGWYIFNLAEKRFTFRGVSAPRVTSQ